MRAGKRVPKALVVLATTTIVLLAMLIWFLYALPAQMDAAAKQREERLVANGFAGVVEGVEHSTVPQTSWDDAVANLDNKFSEEWAEENIGKYFFSTDGIEFTAVVNGAGPYLFFSKQGKMSAPREASPFDESIRPLIRAVRIAESLRGALRPSKDGAFISSPIQATSLRRFGDGLFIVTATLVQPDFGKALPSQRAPIVLTAKEVDQGLINALTQRFLLQGADLKLGEVHNDGRRASAGLPGADGKVIATLEWRPQQPGLELRNKLTPIAFGILLIAGVVGFLAYRRLLKGSMKLIESEARAVHIATHDALTGLHERAYFLKRFSATFEEYCTSGKSFAALSINLDGMKEINERFGHARGDELLIELARRLNSLCEEAYVAARFGGDEFALLMPCETVQDASDMAEAIIKIVAAPADLSCGPVSVTCCVGACTSGPEAQTFQECLNNLEFAMRIAKAEGQGRYAMFSPALAQAQKKRSELLSDLKQAVAQNALSVVYQPQGDLSGNVVGVESLVRWTHPEHGPISPDLFVALAEESDLINELGYFVMRRAFEDSRNWPGLKIAINVSARQLYMPGFMKRVNDMLVETRVDPSRFELEITERLIMTDDQLTYDVLHELNDYGFSIALDDFGAGYSNLSYLCRFPIEKIKIDKEFVDGLGEDPDAEMLVRAIVQLAYAMRLNVIAEGVETADQRTLLAAAGCTTIQGYLFSRPLTPEQLTAFLCNDSAPASLAG